MSYSSQQASDFQSKLKRVDQNTSQSADQHGYTDQSQTSPAEVRLGHSRPSRPSTTTSSSRTIKRRRDESTTRSHAQTAKRQMLNPSTRASKGVNQSSSDMMDFEYTNSESASRHQVTEHVHLDTTPCANPSTVHVRSVRDEEGNQDQSPDYLPDTTDSEGTVTGGIPQGIMVDGKGGGVAGAAGSVEDELASIFDGLALVGFGEQFDKAGILNVSNYPETLDIEDEVSHEPTH